MLGRSEEVKGNEKRGVLFFWGRVLCVVGILQALLAAFFVSIALGAIGAFLGVAGYFLGSRKLGIATIAVGMVSIFVGLFIGQGGTTISYDATLNGIKETIQHPFSDNRFQG